MSPYPWLYLRDREPLAPTEEVAQVVAVGDVLLGRGVADEPTPLAAIGPVLRAADLTVGNLECVIIDESETLPVSEVLEPMQAPPVAASLLRAAGFDLLGLANNHTLDLGTAGLAETASRLRRVGITTVGAGADARSAFQGAIREVNGVRLAFLAFNAVTGVQDDQLEGWCWADWEPERALAAVAAAAAQADGVVVSIHWGYEYQTQVDPAQRAAAGRLLQAGADLVVGHHPHVVQAFEVDGERCVAYSLGNFVFDQRQGETGQGLALQAFFNQEGLRAVRALPVEAGECPQLMALDRAEALLNRLVPSRRLSFACDEQGCRSVDASGADAPNSGPFWGGRIDLSGDGIPEHVRRVANQVVIYQDDAEAWRSPSTWRVVDVALGDPNDDGRGEVLLALWKPGLDGLETPTPDKEIVPRSHPFIIGHRGGSYRLLWGGSAVRDPIHEVELGDVDGDAVQELVVLDGVDPRQRTVSVWRWHGWGFSLVWRSNPGPYLGLSVADNGSIHVLSE